MAEIEKLDLKSMDIVEEKREQLKALFPEVFTEGQKIDFERLKLSLGEMVDPGKERYGMNWPGKADCFKIIQQPSIAALTPARDESVDFDTTENLFIEGDNLEVLKLLQKSYFGKVKMIYIDPPYNTGNDFIYPDDYSESLDTYLRYTGQIDNEGRKYSTNTEADGRFHSKWLNMMYPRLFLASNLLKHDGFVLVSIDDAELTNLRTLMNEIFGEENFVAVLVYDRNRKNDAKLFSVGHEYMVVYAKSKGYLTELRLKLRAPKEGIDEVKEEFERLQILQHDNWKSIEEGLRDYYATFAKDDPRLPLARYTKVDEKGPYRTDGNPSWPGGGGPRYDVPHPKTGKPCKVPGRGWVWPTYERMKEEIEKGNIAFGPDETTIPAVRMNLFEKSEQVMRSVIFSYAQKASQDFNNLFDGKKVFENPKSQIDLKRLVEYLTCEADVILDFFAGTGTTAHGVLLANRETRQQRRFILVQLPELIEGDSEVGKNAIEIGFKTIADIGKERIRRVIKKIKVENEKKKDLFTADTQGPDLGFKVFKLQPSNFKLWDGDVAKEKEAIEKQIALFVEHINPKSSQEDILYEILLKSGFPLTTKIEKTVLAERDVFSIADGSMLICLEKDLTSEVIKEMAEMKPVRVVCLDEGFKGNDQLKTNAVQIMKTRNITFRTV